MRSNEVEAAVESYMGKFDGNARRAFYAAQDDMKSEEIAADDLERFGYWGGILIELAEKCRKVRK